MKAISIQRVSGIHRDIMEKKDISGGIVIKWKDYRMSVAKFPSRKQGSRQRPVVVLKRPRHTVEFSNHSTDYLISLLEFQRLELQSVRKVKGVYRYYLDESIDEE